MSLDLAINLATEEYIKSINEITKKYNLPLSAIEIILRDILDQVIKTKTDQINQEKSKLAEEANQDKPKAKASQKSSKDQEN